MSRSRLVVIVLLAVLPAVVSSPAEAVPTYRPPVDAPVVDGFRLPDGPYGAGNRGLEYATAPGTTVRAIGDGLVVFAGAVAGSLHVTVLHPDGLRSSYSYLAEIAVKAGARVALGQEVGVAGERLHLGVRAGGTYLDPAALFTAPGVHLVPLEVGVPNGSRYEIAPQAARVVDQNRTWDWVVGR